jgi:hypothetical protein
MEPGTTVPPRRTTGGGKPGAVDAIVGLSVALLVSIVALIVLVAIFIIAPSRKSGGIPRIANAGGSRAPSLSKGAGTAPLESTAPPQGSLMAHGGTGPLPAAFDDSNWGRESKSEQMATLVAEVGREVRDATWARSMESRLTEAVRAESRERATLHSARCGSTRCVVELVVPGESSQTIRALALVAGMGRGRAHRLLRPTGETAVTVLMARTGFALDGGPRSPGAAKPSLRTR